MIEIDCTACRWHNYDWGLYGDEDEYEICDKGHELYPDECEDYTEW